MKVFLSVGTTDNEEQEKMIVAIEERLRAEGIEPYTVGRSSFSSHAPLKAISKLMKECSGTIVIAMERMYFPNGVEKQGTKSEKHLNNVKLPTPWNQIEAAMGYSYNHPLMVMVEDGLRNDGLLEYGHDWYIQSIPTPYNVNYLNSQEFNQVLKSWKKELIIKSNEKVQVKPSELTIQDIVYSMKPSHLWSTLVAISALISGAFILGVKSITM